MQTAAREMRNQGKMDLLENKINTMEETLMSIYTQVKKISNGSEIVLKVITVNRKKQFITVVL